MNLKSGAFLLLLAFLLGMLAAFVPTYSFFEHQRQSAELSAERITNAAYATAVRRVMTTERAAAAVYQAASAHYQTELDHVQKTHAGDVARLRAGNLRLRFAPDPGCGATHPATATGTTGRDDATRADLSPATAEFLLGLAADADQITHQLTACQTIVRADREALRAVAPHQND